MEGKEGEGEAIGEERKRKRGGKEKERGEGKGKREGKGRERCPKYFTSTTPLGPACNQDPAFMQDPASTRSFTVVCEKYHQNHKIF